MVSNLPLSSLTLKPPPDGLPCIGDFTTTCISYLFSGSRLHREPLDVNFSEEQLKAAEYQVVVTNLSHDFKEAVLHMRDQISVGMEVVNSFMTKRAMMIVGDKNQGSLPALQRRIITDATNRFGAPTEIGKMHHIGFLDFSKFGRLTMIDINAAVDWAKQVLMANEDYSMVIAIAPLLASEGVLGGLRGEMRRIEDKFVDSGLECKMIQVPFDLSQLHGEYVTPESGTFFTHEQGRSPTDKEETAQWVAAPATLKSIIESCMSRVSSMKSQTCIIHHFTAYDGNLEKARWSKFEVSACWNKIKFP
ncbi:unnamed protein product [Durusdinium trenchii]|uniref:Uncharacterized protein n=1 Tax=Durusdinium trenchii TaxID=1381693 RepID=A0ABP0M5P0_9DINO